MNEIEELVRRSLHDRVAVAPALSDPAGRAVAGARRVRRRRTFTTVGAAALVAVLIPIGAAGLRGRHHAPPVPAATPTPTATADAGVAVIVKPDTLVLADGRRVALPGGGPAGDALQLRQGVLVRMWDGQLYLVPPDGTAHPLATGVTAGPVAASDGSHLAWRTMDRLAVGHLAADGTLVSDRSTPIGPGGIPIALATAGVVLGGTRTGGGIDAFDLWLPAHGDYVPTWTAITTVAGVYGPAPGGQLVLGLVFRAPGTGSKDLCLAELDPADTLHATRTACGLPLNSEADASVSPDGHWLVARTADGSWGLIDLTTVFGSPAIVRTWPAGAAPGGWLDAGTLFMLGSGGPTRIDVATGRREPVAVPGVPAGAELSPVGTTQSD